MKVLTSKKKNSTEKITNAFIGSPLIILPLSTFFRDYSVIARSKFITLCALTAIYLVGCAILCLRTHKLPHLTTKPKAALIVLGCYAVAVVVSTVVSPYRGKAIIGASRYEGLISILLYALIFFAVYLFGKPKAWMMYAMGLSSLVVSFVALMQFSGRNPLSLYPNGLNYYDAGSAYEGAYISTIGNADVAGAWLALSIPILLFYIVLAKKDMWRFFLILPLGTSILTWYRLDVTASILGVTVGCVAVIPFFLKNARKKIPLLLIYAILFIAAIAALYFVDFKDGMLYEAHAILHGRVADNFGASRIWVWQETWKIAKDHLLFGTGPDVLALYGAEHVAYNSMLDINVVVTIDVAHNLLLNILAQHGILALISCIAFSVFVFIDWVKKAPYNVTAAVCGAGAMCYFIQAMFSMESCAVTPILMIALALMLQERAQG